MNKLGYTWYPQDWWSSNTYRRLKKYPMVRYAIRELIDLMYKEGKPIEMNRCFLEDDFDITLSDIEYEQLMKYVIVLEDGLWWIDSVKKRISKAETSRINGAKGGRPKKTQKPKEKTQEQNPKNPPLEIEREIEREIEVEYSDIDKGVFKNIEQLKTQYLKNEKLINALSKNLKIDPKTIPKLLDEFNEQLASQNKFMKTNEDYTEHFRNWIPKRPKPKIKGLRNIKKMPL